MLEDEIEGDVRDLGEWLYRAAGPPVAGDPGRSQKRLAILALRRAVHNRRPLHPALLDASGSVPDPELRERLERHRERTRRLLAHEESYREAFSADLLAARDALFAIAGDARFREGIRLASRTLFQALDSMHDDRHVASKVAAYAARGAAKTSPHSVFCATALASLTSGPARVTGENAFDRIEVLLNVFEARKVTSCLAADPEIRAAASLRSNPTLREAEGAWIYWRPAALRRLTDDEVLSRVRDLPVLRMFLEEIAAGSRSAREVLRAVEMRSGVVAPDLERFLEQAVESGIFLWEMEIPYNCRRPLLALARACRDAPCVPPWLPVAEDIERQVDLLPGLGPDERLEKLEAIQRRLESLPHVRSLKEDEIFRLDASTGLEVALPLSILDEIQEAVEWYARLFASLYPETILRAGYVERFLEAHPPDRDVPLLDLYHGLFEPEPMLRPAAFPLPSGARSGEAMETARRRFMRARDAFSRLAKSAAAEGREEVALTPEHWSEILEEAPAPAWFCGVLFQVAAASADDLACGRTRIALNAFFTGSGLASARLDHLLGRGRSPNESPVAREVKKEWSHLERKDAILAEVTYMHWGRTANAGLRPSLFSYEIELPGEKASEGAQVIPLRDLVVRYDAREKRFVLTWLPRGLEVIPVVGSGISPEGFVSFLVSLGQQGFQPLTHFPGFEADGIITWPRFTWKRTVLFRRRWIFAAGSLPPALTNPSAPEAEAFAAWTRLRRRHGLPRHVFVQTSVEPKPFYSDLESPVLTELARRAASPRGDRTGLTLTFTEMLPSPEDLWVRDQKGRYASEFLVQLHGPRN